MRRLIPILFTLVAVCHPASACPFRLLPRLFHHRQRPAVAVLAPAPTAAYTPPVLEPATYQPMPTQPIYSTPSNCPGGVCPKR